MERIYLPAIIKGMMHHAQALLPLKKATIQYPEQKRPFSAVYRGLHVLKRDDQGRERCTACGLCAVACPAEAITMVARRTQEGRRAPVPRGEVRRACTRSTCCAASSAAIAKRPAPRRPSSSPTGSCRADYLRRPFVYRQGTARGADGSGPARRREQAADAGGAASSRNRTHYAHNR